MGVGGPRDALSFRGAEVAAETQQPVTQEEGQIRHILYSSLGFTGLFGEVMSHECVLTQILYYSG